MVMVVVVVIGVGVVIAIIISINIVMIVIIIHHFIIVIIAISIIIVIIVIIVIVVIVAMIIIQPQVHARMPPGHGDALMHLAERAVAVSQHHDAVTGTAKQHVTDDYAVRLHQGMEACRDVMVEGLAAEMAGSSCGFSAHCPLLNISQCGFTESRERLGDLSRLSPTPPVLAGSACWCTTPRPGRSPPSSACPWRRTGCTG